MADIQFSRFHYLYCPRTVSHIANPRIFDKIDFVLPRDSVLHYIPSLPFGDVPSMQWYPLREYINGSRRPYIKHIFDMAENWGTTRVKSGVNIENYRRWFIKNNRRMIPVKENNETDALGKHQQPFVVNYGFLPARYRYMPNPMNRLYRYRNILDTVVREIESLQQKEKRYHFLFFPVPFEIPSRQHLVKSLESETITFADIFKGVGDQIREIVTRNENNPITHRDEYGIPSLDLESTYTQFANEVNESLESFDESALGWNSSFESSVAVEDWNRQVLQWFPDDPSIFIAEFWKFISEERPEGSFGKFSEKNYEYINFVFEVGDKYTVLNLKWLNDQLKIFNPRGSMGQSDSYLKFLDYFNKLNEFKTIVNKPFILQSVPEELGEVVTLYENEPESTEIEDDDYVDNNVTDSKESIEAPITGSIRRSAKSILGIKDQSLMQNSFGGNSIRENTQKDKRVKVLDENSDFNFDDIPTSKTLVEPVAPVEDAPVVIDFKPSDLEYQIAVESRDLLRKGLISRAEFNRNIKLAQSYKKIKSPDGNGTIEDYMKVDHATIWDLKPRKLMDSKHLFDESMAYSTLRDFDQIYIQEVLDRETVATVIHAFQKAGIAVTDLKRERNTNVMDDMKHYIVKLSPAYGDVSSFRFSIPVIDRNGKYRINGNKYYQRKLRTDKPIRKISPHRVQLQTAYSTSKLFVDRSQKKVNDTGEWLIRLITADILSDKPSIKNVQYGNVFKDGIKVPRYYSALARKYISFQLGDYQFYFDYANRDKHFTADELKKYKDSKHTLCGHYLNEPLFMDARGNLTTPDRQLGNIENIIPNPDNVNKPLELATLRLMKKDIPMGVFLGYLMGLNKLVEELGVQPRKRVRGTKRDTQPHEFEITFSDEVWVFPDDHSKAALIMGSFYAWRNVFKNYTVEEMNDPSTYNSILEDAGLSPRFVIEFKNINQLFIDIIAADNLREMGEPTEVIPLMLRAVEMLEDDYYPSEHLDEFSLIKGYERMNAEVHRTIVRGIRDFRNQPMTARARININPFEVITEIQSDPSVSLAEDSNPVHNTKEKDNCTYSGTGGRSKLTMVKRTREFHQSNIGVRSEATVDSGDVAIIQQLTADPNITSLRGTFKGLDPKTAPVTKLLSTTSVLAPFATYDDPKRANFISIQQSHVIETAGAMPYPIRTGYDLMMAQRTDDIFSFRAKGEGRITLLDEDHVVITYKDPKLPEDRVQLGTIFGTVTGHASAQRMICDLSVGTKVEEGMIVAFNPGFYRRDWRDPRYVVWLVGPLGYVTFMEQTYTFEDSSRIRTEFANTKMVSPVPEIKLAFANFDEEVVNLVNEGTEVDIDSVLCYITQGTLTGEETNFSEDTLNNLKSLGAATPRAGTKGVVSKIEVYYLGDREEMSPSIKRIVTKYDNKQRKLAKKLGEGCPETGEVYQPTRINGTSLEMNMVIIKFYITRSIGLGDGDKIVVGNQEKTVVSGHIAGKCQTVSEIIPGMGIIETDVQFSYRSEMARIVPSVERMGYINLMLRYIAFHTAKIYFGE